MIAQEIWFYDAKHHYEIPTGSTPMEAPNAGKGWYRPQLVCFQRLSRTFYTVLLIVYQMHLIDYLITLVFVRVCVSVHRSVVERLRPQFFTDFHQILHAAQKCGCFEGYCLWEKPEVDYRFLRCAKSDFGSFAIVVDIFSHGRMPILAVSR